MKTLLLLTVALVVTSGCQTPPNRPVAASGAKDSIRVNSCSLLFQLLDQQRNVDKLLLIKLETPELKQLIKAIAQASDTAARHLQEFSLGDASLHLDQTALPPGEVAARESISKAKTKELLKPFNPQFEEELLLTQTEALSYASHLAKVAAENEIVPQRTETLGNISKTMEGLRHQTVSLLHTRLSAPRSKPAG